MNFTGLTTVSQGTVGLSAAIFYFVSNGYHVSIPLNDNQCYDLIVEKENILYRVQVKTTGQKAESGNYTVELRSIRPNKNRNNIKNFDNTKVDLLFIQTESNDVYLIPAKALTVKSTITLYEKYDIYKMRA